jgi:DNA polymerase III alpha subunit
VPLTEPDHAQRLRDETELLSLTVSGHPLEQFPDVAWDTYCPIRDLARYPGETVHVCGLIIADRSHHQITGDAMKFITICDYTGTIECEIFAQPFRRFGLETVRHPVVELEARVTPFDSGIGCTLDVLRIGRARRCASNDAAGSAVRSPLSAERKDCSTGAEPLDDARELSHRGTS